MAYAYPQYDRRIFVDTRIERKAIKMALERLFQEATDHYKTNTYTVESINIVPIDDRGGVDLYLTVRR